MLITSSWMLDFLFVFIGLIFFLYKYSTRKFNYWKERGVYHNKPIPFIGNFWDIFFFTKTVGDWLKDLYDSTEEPYLGIFVLDEPSLIIKSPKLIKQIMVKDFNYFSDRTIASPKHNEVISNMMFVQKGPEWKLSRTKMTPIFTSGKLKNMLPIIKTVGQDLVYYLEKNLGVQEAKEICCKYATDVVSKCAFGINAHCFDDEDSMFRKIGRAMFEFSFKNAMNQTAYFFRQSWVELFKLDFFDRWIQDYFVTAFWNTMKQREESNSKANDLVDILRDIMKSQDIPNFEGDKVAAQATQFFAAGFETTASTIAHTLYELAVNPNIQKKLGQEILTNLKEHKGITYEGLMNMKYLDMCICETLRKYPVLPFLDRKCLENYQIPGTSLIVEKGMAVYIPMYGLHQDEKFFPEPKQYKPERFLQNINNEVDGIVYIPFGYGPRNCIGERFGTLSAKTAIAYILSNFELEKCSKTPIPIEFEPKSFTLQSKVGLPMTFKRLIPMPA